MNEAALTNESENVIDIKNLRVHYNTRDGVVEAVNDVSFSIKRGETFGLVGETGAGKTTIALAMMRLLPIPPAKVIGGTVFLDGEDLYKKTKKEMSRIRGRKISMIFQDPMTALDPVHTVGDQISEVIKLHQSVSQAEAQVKAVDMLETVGIPGDRYSEYPHQFSGGMKQRIVIAIALACNPEVLIADEPTTALDVTIQAQILDLMRELRAKYNTSMLLITHDFGVVAEICDKCAVIYAGEIVEMGRVSHLFNNPLHPYTIGLFRSIPTLDTDTDRLEPIPGMVENPMNLPPYCSFFNRCKSACEKCKEANPELKEVEPGHFVRCFCLNKEA